MIKKTVTNERGRGKLIIPKLIIIFLFLFQISFVGIPRANAANPSQEVDIGINKTLLTTPGPYYVGDCVTFELSATNYGPLAASNGVKIHDTLMEKGSTVFGDVVANPTYSISGMKFNDLDSSGTKNGSEGGLSGWTIYIDADNDGVLDAGETSTTTALDGGYSFTDLLPGTYYVSEVVQSGWTQTFPTSPNYYHTVVITDGNITEKDFGNHQNKYSISGMKFNDLDSSGTKK